MERGRGHRNNKGSDNVRADHRQHKRPDYERGAARPPRCIPSPLAQRTASHGEHSAISTSTSPGDPP